MVELLRREAFGLLRQGNAAQVTGNDPEVKPALHTVLPVIGAFAPAKVPPQTRNAPLDARTPAIAARRAPRALDRLAFLRELARRRDGHPLDPGGHQALLGLRRMHPPVASQQTGRMLKERLVVPHRFDGLPMLGGVFQNLVARHDAALHLVEDDVAAKLDERTALVARNGARVRLEKADHLLARSHLLALQHTTAFLGDHALDQSQDPLRLPSYPPLPLPRPMPPRRHPLPTLSRPYA